MTEEELRRRVRLGEDSYTEFKERIDHPESLAGEIVAFANTEGGRLIVGVSDDGRIVGVADAAQGSMLLAQICRDGVQPPILPLIEVSDVDGRSVLVLEVRGPHKQYRTKGGRYYVRAGPMKQDASQGELLRLMQRVGLFRFDETPVPGKIGRAHV